VGGGIVFAEISLNFDDAAREVELSVVTHQDFAEEFASYAARVAGEEGAWERPELEVKMLGGIWFLHSDFFRGTALVASGVCP
jgi:hypothetical protein